MTTAPKAMKSHILQMNIHSGEGFFADHGF